MREKVLLLIWCDHDACITLFFIKRHSLFHRDARAGADPDGMQMHFKKKALILIHPDCHLPFIVALLGDTARRADSG